MRRKGLWLGVLAAAMIAGSASAATIATSSPVVTSGAWTGLTWGTYNYTNEEFLHNSVSLTANSGYRWAPGATDALNDSTPDAHTPGAGGGQNYDAEAMFYFFDSSTNYLHLGLITGFNPFGETGDSASPFYRSGDIFIGFGTSGEYQLALGTGLGSPSLGTNLESSTRAGNAWYDNYILDTGWADGNPLAPGLQSVSHTSSPNLSQANPYRVLDTDSTVSLLTSNVDYAYSRLWTSGTTPGGTPNPTGIGNSNNERWFYEYRVALNPNGPLGSLIDSLTDPLGGIGVHWTMGCGNDYISKVDNTPFAPVVPVPAAAPMALLGMALVSLVRRKRQAKC